MRPNVQSKKTDSEAESERGARLTFFLGTHAEVVAEDIEDLAMCTVIKSVCLKGSLKYKVSVSVSKDNFVNMA